MRSVIVTGASSGIGRAMVELFAKEEGDQIFAADIAAADFDADNITFVPCDVSDPDSVRSMINVVRERSGQIDVLCNNAGARGGDGSVVSCEPEAWDAIFSVNTKGVYLGCHYAVPAMLERGGGVIINTASVAGLFPLRDRAAYCASKGAVIALTRQIALQYAGQGIRCNCICPGPIDTPGTQALRQGRSGPREEEHMRRQPMQRMGTPEEIAQTAFYLASSAASYVTGTAMIADGGVTLSTPLVREP